MPLPETIPVRFTEEEADYVTIRPVKRQTFKLRELVDMVLCVTGRDLGRVQKILRSGTVVFHFYRYWWQGIEASDAELSALLADFPADDPTRAFQAESCNVIVIESAAIGRLPVEVERLAAEKKPLFASRSFWESLLEISAAPLPVIYGGYSFARRADVYRVELTAEQAAGLLQDASKLAPRALRGPIASLGTVARVEYVCPRSS